MNDAKKAAKKAATQNLSEFNDAEADAEMRLVETMALGEYETMENDNKS
jgi:hypothetical protein